MGRRYRVIQWTTGSIWRFAIQRIAESRQLELVGCYVTSAAKAGRDAGELAGLAPLGVIATRDAAALLELPADCVCYAPMRYDLDEICRILESGKNLVTPSGFTFPAGQGAGVRERLEEACRRGGVSIHGSGIHPGFAGDRLVLTLTALCRSVEQVRVSEYADLSPNPSTPQMFDQLGFGRPPAEHLAKPSPLIGVMGTIFRESMHMIAAGLGFGIEDFRAAHAVAAAVRDVDVAAGHIRAGGVAAQQFEWTAISAGRAAIVFRTRWKMCDELDPAWEIPAPGYEVIVEGDPSLRCTLNGASSFTGRDVPERSHSEIGRIWTAMNTVNAIPAVCDAKPGIRTSLDLPLLAAQDAVRWAARGEGRA